MKNIFLVATIAMVTEKFLFSISMATIVRETNSFIKSSSLSIQSSLKNWNQTDKVYSWKIVTNVYLVLH